MCSIIKHDDIIHYSIKICWIIIIIIIIKFNVHVWPDDILHKWESPWQPPNKTKCVTFTSCFVISSERRWRRGWRGWRRSELLWRIQWLRLGLAPPPPPHWRGQAVQATPPRTLIIPADQWEVVTSYCGRAGPSHLPSEGGGAWWSVLLHLFQFLSSVCWFLSDWRFRRAETFVFFLGAMAVGGVCTELTGRGRGGAYCLLLVTAEGGASVQPPISRLPGKIINK